MYQAYYPHGDLTHAVVTASQVMPWREMISSGSLTPVTPDPAFRRTEPDALDGREWYSKESEGSMARRREEGRAMLRTWSARRFRSANHQLHSLMVGPGEDPEKDAGRGPISAPRYRSCRYPADLVLAKANTEFGQEPRTSWFVLGQ